MTGQPLIFLFFSLRRNFLVFKCCFMEKHKARCSRLFSQAPLTGLMCSHYENSLCAVRLDSCVDQKEKMSSHYHFRILFASKESKQDYVSLVLFRIRALTYASCFPKQQLLHSRVRLSQRWRHIGWAHCPTVRGEETGIKGPRGPGSLAEEERYRPWHGSSQER